MNAQSQEIYPEIQFASDRSILIRAGSDISREIHERVLKYFLLIRSAGIRGVQSINPAYNSILITFDSFIIHPNAISDRIKTLLTKTESVAAPTTRLIEIPVCYDEEFALDISNVADQNSLTIEEVIQIHTQPEYLVYFMGFSPGFPYLGDMPKEISTPRLQTPRVKVPAGSVAIGGDHTGIYPVTSPGGWNIIGRTPLKLFSPENEDPTLLKMGDKIKFVPISKIKFKEIAK
jgi:inhibitor of KinA